MGARFLAATLAAASVLASADARAGRWSDWEEEPDAPFTASFAPAVDSRSHSFSAHQLDGYAAVYGRTPFPGDVVVSPAPVPEEAPRPRSVEPGSTISVVVEAVPVSGDRDGRPGIAAGAHFAENPFLPFGTPSGKSEEPVSRSVLQTAAPGPGASVSVPLRLPEGYVGRASEGMIRVRWKVLSADGRTLAKGVLPEAFRQGWTSAAAKSVVDATDGFSVRGDKLRALPATWDAWPLLVSSADGVAAGGGWFDAAFGEGSGRDPALFVERARLAGIGLQARDSGTAEKLAAAGFAGAAPDVVVRWTAGRSPSGDDATPLSGTKLCSLREDGGHGPIANAAVEREAERKLEPARIPGEALGRDGRKFVSATAVFLLAFAAGAVFLLVRFFALRKGEARLAVWSALPIWSAACAAFALLVLPRFLDRRPYADVTEWRYAHAGSREAFCTAIGRSQTFSASPSVWSVPPDAWFTGNSVGAGRVGHYATERDGIQTVTFGGERVFAELPPRKRGTPEITFACRFAPHENPVSISPDPDFDREAFLGAAGMGATPVEGDSAADSAAEPDPKAVRTLRAMLTDWTTGTLPARHALRPAPARSVTAHQELDAVYAFARGCWYALGPMKAGETRALDNSMRVSRGMAISGKPWENIFATAPFAVADGKIKRYAHAWLAKAPGGGGSGSATEGDDDDRAQKDEAFNGAATADIAGRLGSAAVVALKNAGPEDGPFLRPELPDGAGESAVTGRIAFMEVFP